MSNQQEQTSRPAGAAVPPPAAPSRAVPPGESAAKSNGDPSGKAAEMESKVYPITAEVEELMNQFIEDEEIDTNLSGKERMRLFGAGVRNFGFIEKAYDLGRENPDFLPSSNFNIQMMYWNLRELEDARQLFWVLQQFSQAANELVLRRADVCFRDALRIYGNLRELARARVPGAEVLYRQLLSFFRRRRPRADESEPTQKELERDFMKLIHGHADGEIEIVNEQPRFVGGVRKVVDNVHTGHAAVKETAEAETKS